MSPQKRPAAIHLWSGDFASQQLAFAHFLDSADRAGVTIDLDQVEVIPSQDHARRLAPYLEDTPDVAPDKTVVLYAAPTGAPCPFENTVRLTYLGCHDGHVTRAKAKWS